MSTQPQRLELSESDLQKAVEMYVVAKYPEWRNMEAKLTWHATEGLLMPSITLTIEEKL